MKISRRFLESLMVAPMLLCCGLAGANTPATPYILVDPKLSADIQGGGAPNLPDRIDIDGLTLFISSTAVKQGSAFWLRAESSSFQGSAAGSVEIDEIVTPLYRSIDQSGKVALSAAVGIPFSEKPGISDLKVRIEGAKEVTIKIYVYAAEEDRNAELLNLPRGKITLSSTELFRRLADEDREIDEVFDLRTSQHTWNQPLSLPFAAKYKVTSRYGKTRIYSSSVQRRVHWGVDFAVPVGTSILASLPGTVALAKEFAFLGKTVVLDHGYGFMTLYTHLKEITVSPGSNVANRQVIGKSGTSGKSTGPLIHWGAVLSGVKVDPIALMELMRAQKSL